MNFKPGKPGTIGVILVNYGALKLTLNCVKSILMMYDPQVRIWVVDNGSSVKEQGRLRKELSGLMSVTLKLLAANVGLVKANNLGILKALEAGVEYIWILNNDTLVVPDASRIFIKYFKKRQLKPRTNLLSSIITDQSGLRVWANGLDDLPYLNFPKSRDKGKLVSRLRKDPDLLPVQYLSSCSIFCHRQFIEAKGYLPEEYFIYFDDLDWSSRGRCLTIQQPLVQHLVASTVGKAGTDSFNAFKGYWYGRNMILFYFKRKQIPMVEKIIYLLVTIWIWAGLYIRDWKTLRAFFRGIDNGLWQTT